MSPHHHIWSCLEPHTLRNLKSYCAETCKTESEVVRHAVGIFLCNWLAIRDHDEAVAAALGRDQ